MAVEVDVLYQGELRCRATHGPSGDQLTTDAPVDNHGKGESFSPTDLVATALGACSLTIMGIVAQRNGLDIEGAKAHVTKEMATQPVRRIGALKVTITIPAEKAAKLSADDRKKLQEGALHCPVHKSLHPDIAAPIEFVYSN
ncbi:MAG: OsmC family protein [Planctomycetaceae bacterium]